MPETLIDIVRALLIGDRALADSTWVKAAMDILDVLDPRLAAELAGTATEAPAAENVAATVQAENAELRAQIAQLQAQLDAGQAPAVPQ